MIRTFVDAGVLIAGFRIGGTVGRRALAVLNDRTREYISSPFVRLEVLPKSLYFGRREELAFYQAFFAGVTLWPAPLGDIVERASREASRYGLNAIDALHVAAALLAGAEEFITTEKPDKPIHRVAGLTVVSIHGAM